VRIEAQEMEVTQGGIVLATTNELEVTAGEVVAGLADTASWIEAGPKL
jgi:co-chaperonin GroES (HSP10)